MAPLCAGWNFAQMPGMAFGQGLPKVEDNFIKKGQQVFPKDYEEALKLWPHSDEKEVERQQPIWLLMVSLSLVPGNGLTCRLTAVRSRCTGIYSAQ